MFSVRGILTSLQRPISLDTKVQFELGISQIKAGSMGYKFISINFPVDPLFIFILLILYHPSTLTWKIAPHENTDYILLKCVWWNHQDSRFWFSTSAYFSIRVHQNFWWDTPVYVTTGFRWWKIWRYKNCVGFVDEM